MFFPSGVRRDGRAPPSQTPEWFPRSGRCPLLGVGLGDGLGNWLCDPVEAEGDGVAEIRVQGADGGVVFVVEGGGAVGSVSGRGGVEVLLGQPRQPSPAVMPVGSL